MDKMDYTTSTLKHIRYISFNSSCWLPACSHLLKLCQQDHVKLFELAWSTGKLTLQ